jgi:hypothetical protein
MKTFLSANALARTLEIPMSTLSVRLRSRHVEPDGIVITGDNTPSGFLFSTERLATFRKLLCGKSTTSTHKI